MFSHRQRVFEYPVICGLLFGAASQSIAQNFPAKPIRLVVPLAPGGGSDIVARLIAQKVSTAIGQPVVVDNRPGGSTMIGTEIVARAAPDGYTLVMATSSHGINPSLYKLPFDPVRDFSGVAFVATTPLMLVVHPNVPARSVKELIAVAKARPGQLNYATAGSASIPHMASELFNIMAGVKTVHIPYKCSGPALNDLLSGQVDMMFASPIPALPFVKLGRLRAIAMTSAERSPAMPDLPTVMEAGVAGFEAGSYYIVLGPAHMPGAIVAKLNSEMLRAAQLPDLKDRMAAQGANVVGGTPQQAIAHIEKDIARWANVVKSAGITANP